MSTTTQTSAVAVAALPRVNLLPPEIEEGRRLRRVQAGLGAGVVGAVAVVGVLTLMAAQQVSSAQDDLDGSKAQGQTLQAQVDSYADVPAVYAQVDAAEAQLSQAMGSEIRWSYFLNDLSLRTPSKVWLESLTVTSQDAAAAAATATGTGEYLQPGLAQISVEGRGYRHNDVAAWLEALSKEKGVSQPYFTTSKQDTVGTEDAVSFTSQATVTEDALSHRYTQKADQ